MAICPKCSTEIDKSMSECPGCGVKFNWGAKKDDGVKVGKCPKCGGIVTTAEDKCGNCGANLQWGEYKSSGPRKDDSSNLLLKISYWVAMLDIFFPIIGIVMLIMHKDYAQSINRDKCNCYSFIMKRTVTCSIVWGLILIGLAIVAISSYNKASAG